MAQAIIRQSKADRVTRLKECRNLLHQRTGHVHMWWCGKAPATLCQCKQPSCSYPGSCLVPHPQQLKWAYLQFLRGPGTCLYPLWWNEKINSYVNDSQIYIQWQKLSITYSSPPPSPTFDFTGSVEGHYTAMTRSNQSYQKDLNSSSPY